MNIDMIDVYDGAFLSQFQAERSNISINQSSHDNNDTNKMVFFFEWEFGARTYPIIKNNNKKTH